MNPPEDLIDVNVTLSRWPFRLLPGDEPEALVKKLTEQTVTQAWAGSFDGLFHRDIAGVNERLAETCAKHGRGILVPFGSINPMLPDWEDDLRRCHEFHKMPGIRLHPNYHGYKLDAAVFEKLLTAAAEQKVIVQLAISMEDERTQHPLMPVPHVDATPLAAIVKRLPSLKLVLLNAFRGMTIPKVADLLAAGNVHVDLAMLEGVNGVIRLIDATNINRILFGSHFPFFLHESATLKLKESPLGDTQQKAIRFENAQHLIVPR